MYAPSDLVALIEGRLSELGMTQAQLGLRAFGKADNTAIQSLKKGSSPAIDRLEAMAKALGWELYFGPPRHQSNSMSDPPANYNYGRPEPSALKYLTIPWLEPRIGAGAAPVAFLHSWLVSNGLIIDNLAAVSTSSVRIDGFDGSKTLVLLDSAAPRHGFDYWVLKKSDTIEVARVCFDDSDLIIEGQHQGAPPRLVRDWRKSTMQPAGKVVWFGLMPES